MSEAPSAFLVADLEIGRAGLRRVQAAGRRGVRWLQARSFGFAPEQLGLAEGLRAATAVAVLVLATLALHWPMFAWTAYAAFWACLADPGGPDRHRLRVMGAFVLGGAALAGVMSCVASVAGPVVTVAVLFAVVGLCGMSRLLGADMAQAGLLVNVAAVVAVDIPTAPAQALVLSGVFLGGGVLAIVLCLLVWRVHPHRPTRRAVAAVFRDLAEMTAELARAQAAAAPDAGGARRLESEHRWAVRNAIERARSKVEQLAAWRRESPVPGSLAAAVDACDRIFAGLIALGHEGGARLPAHLLDRLDVALAEGRRQVLRSDPDWSGLRAHAEQLAPAAGAATGLAARVASVWSRALLDLAQGRAPAAGGRSPGGAPSQASNPGRVLATARHAIRLATVVLAAYFAAHQFSLPCTYWATVAVVVVMQPYAETAWPRMLERIVGSVVGGLAAAALASVLTTPWQLLMIIFPLAAATIALRSVNYTLFVLFLSPLFVLVTELVTPGQGHAHGFALARAAYNVLGCLLALAGSLLLWPERRPEPLSRRLADAVEANLTYAALTVAPAVARDRVEAARRRAGVCSSAAEAALHRMRLEGRRRRARLDEAGALLAQLRRLAGATTAAWLTVDAAEADERGGPETLSLSGLEAMAAQVRDACRAYAAGGASRAMPSCAFMTNR